MTSAVRKVAAPIVPKDNIVYLLQSTRNVGVPSVSINYLRMETWLRMFGVPYRNMKPLSSMRQSISPFVLLNGVTYPNADRAIPEVSTAFNINESKDYSTETWARGIILESVFKSRLPLSITYYRANVAPDEFFSDQNAGVFRLLPQGKKFYLNLLKKALIKQFSQYLDNVGFGRHEPKEAERFGLDDLKCASEILGAKHLFLGGSLPTRIDAAAFSALAQILYLPMSTPHKQFMKTECRNLVEFCDNIKTNYWPDWERTCAENDINSHANDDTEQDEKTNTEKSD